MVPDSNQPDEILGVPPDADQETVRRAYRKLIKKHRPERDPEGFERIRWAYDCMRHSAPATPPPAARSTGDSAPEEAAQDPQLTEMRSEPVDPAPEPPPLPAGPIDDEPTEPATIPDSVDELIEPWDQNRESDAEEKPALDESETIEEIAPETTPASDAAPAIEELRLSTEDFEPLMERVRLAPDRDAAFGEFAQFWGDQRYRNPDEIAILSMAAAEAEPTSPEGVQLLIEWLGTLALDQDWTLDRLEELQLRNRLHELADDAIQDGIPEAIAILLRDHGDMSIDELRQFGRQRLHRVFPNAKRQRSALRRLRRRHAALWNSWDLLRGRLVGATADERLIGDLSLDRESARNRTSQLMRAMDKEINDASDRPMMVGLMCAFALVTVTWRTGTGWMILLAIACGIAIAGFSVRYGWARAFDRYVEPELRRSLPDEGLTVADVFAVLIERPKATKHWDEVQSDLGRAIPIWLETI